MPGPVTITSCPSPMGFVLSGAHSDFAPITPEVTGSKGELTRLVAPSKPTNNCSSAFMRGGSPFADTLISLGTPTTAVGHPFFEE